MTLTMYFDILRLSLVAAVIGYAAWQDHRNTIKFQDKLPRILDKNQQTINVECGEVSNKTWLYAPIGLALTLISIALTPQDIYLSALSAGATVALVLILSYLGGWGGADAKAFLTIAVSIPIIPFATSPFFLYPLKVIVIAAFLSLIGGALKKRMYVRFLPYTWISMFIALLI